LCFFLFFKRVSRLVVKQAKMKTEKIFVELSEDSAERVGIKVKVGKVESKDLDRVRKILSKGTPLSKIEREQRRE